MLFTCSWKYRPLRESNKLTVAQWVGKLRNYSSPLNWLVPYLSSELELAEKVQIRLRAPSAFYCFPEQIESLEAKIEDADLFPLAQVIRYDSFSETRKTSQELQWCQNMIEADIVGRWTVQREVYVQDQIRVLCKSLELAPNSDKDP